MERIKKIIEKIKRGHLYWVNGNADYKERLEKAFNPLFRELEDLGVARHFSEALLFFGGDFVESLNTDALGRRNIVVEAELLFGVRSASLTDRHKKMAGLATKHNVIAYKELPMKGGKIGIEKL